MGVFVEIRLSPDKFNCLSFIDTCFNAVSTLSQCCYRNCFRDCFTFVSGWFVLFFFEAHKQKHVDFFADEVAATEPESSVIPSTGVCVHYCGSQTFLPLTPARPLGTCILWWSPAAPALHFLVLAVLRLQGLTRLIFDPLSGTLYQIHQYINTSIHQYIHFRVMREQLRVFGELLASPWITLPRDLYRVTKWARWCMPI